jgi:hypothetical protein
VVVLARPDHRGAEGDDLAFAKHFVETRLGGYRKDMQICLTPIPSPSRSGVTHAYFSALGASCGFLEYMSALFIGDINGIGWQQVAAWARRFMPQPDYDQEATRVFFSAFRHSVAHRGIATGIWIDRAKNPHSRVTWKLLANSRRPACILVREDGVLRKDPPWPCKYTHRMHIHLKALELDLASAVSLYVAAVSSEPRLQANFFACMRQMYPR